MTVTRTGALAEREKEEQAKVNAANAKSARMTQVKSTMSNFQLELECMIQKLKVNLTDYRDTNHTEKLAKNGIIWN